MPDITKCKSNNCEKRTSCYRYIVDPSDFRQSYFVNPPMTEDGKCQHYWEIKKKNNDGYSKPKKTD
jgi:hypothetical protein